MAIGQGSLAGYSRVAYEATGLADFENDNQRAARAYRSATRDMTDEALRLELAQDKLRRSLQKGPHAYREQARAELQLRNSERALRGETDALTRSQRANQAGLGSMRRSLVGLAAGYVGVQGLLTLTRSSVSAFREQELVAGQTGVAIETLGVDFDRYSGRLDRAIKQVQQLGFDDEELAKSFQLLAGSARSPEQALDQLGLAADLARGRYVDLEAATQIVNKANLGMSGALRRIGIDVDKNASSFELLTALQERYGRSAEEAMDTGVAAADRFSVSIEEILEVLGGGLAPALADVSNRVSEWVSKEQNMEEVQRKVNAAVETGEQVVRGVAASFRVLDRVLGPVIGHLGGVERAVELAIGAGLLYKSAKAVAAVRGLALSFGLVGPAATRAAAQTVAAENAIGAGAVAATGRVNLLRSALRALVVYSATQAVVDALTPGGQGLDFSDPTGASVTPVNRGGVWVNAQTGERVKDQRYWDKLVAGGYYDPSTGKREKPSKKERREARDRIRGVDPMDATGDLPGQASASTLPPVPRVPTVASLTVPTIAAAVERGAERGSERGVERGMSEAERRRRERQERRMERVLESASRAAERQRDKFSELDEYDLATRGGLRAAALRHVERAQERERLYNLVESRTKIAELSNRIHGFGNEGLRNGPVTPAQLARWRDEMRRHPGDPPATLPQIKSAFFDSLTSFRSMVNERGGNLLAPGSQVAGAPNPELFSMVTELREQTHLLAGLASGVRNPGTRYARTELAAAFEGPTF